MVGVCRGGACRGKVCRGGVRRGGACRGCDVVRCAVVGRDAGNLYLKHGNPGKRYRKQQHNKNEKENCL